MIIETPDGEPPLLLIEEPEIAPPLPTVCVTNVAAAYKLKEWDDQQQTWVPWNVSLPEFFERTRATGTVFCTNLNQDGRFPAAKLVLSARRQHIPLVTFLYFKRGKVVQVGAKSLSCSRLQIALFTTFVLKVFHQKIQAFDFKITNICASGKLAGPLDLHNLHAFLKPKGRSAYRPSTKDEIDSFPALIGAVNPLSKKRMFTLYDTGSFNLVGNKETLDWREGQEYMAFIEREFQANDESVSQRAQRGVLQRKRLEKATQHVRSLSNTQLLEGTQSAKKRRLGTSTFGLLEG